MKIMIDEIILDIRKKEDEIGQMLTAARQKAKDDIANANLKAAEMIDKARAIGVVTVSGRVKIAEEESSHIASDMKRDAGLKAEEIEKNAWKNMQAATDYILKKIIEN